MSANQEYEVEGISSGCEVLVLKGSREVEVLTQVEFD